jgi:hypothetical protein
MPDLPSRPDFGQLRRQAKDLLRAATNGDADALRRMRAVSDRLVLASAQLAVAREYGFGVIDELLEAGTPIDAEDEVWGRQPLRVAAQDGRVAGVRHLLARGADPDVGALECCRDGRRMVADTRGHDETEALLAQSLGLE